MSEVFLANMTLEVIVTSVLPKVFLSLLCGAMVGFERQLKRKAAGMKTHMLISMGACLYTLASAMIWDNHRAAGMPGDPSRVAAQIVSGIGFLGGGAIIHARGTITGLTTAATIWACAALGICVGVGEGLLALLVTIVVVGALTAVSFFEVKILGHAMVFRMRVSMQGVREECRTKLAEHLERNGLVLEQMQTRLDSGKTTVSLRYRGLAEDHRQFLQDIWGTTGVEEVTGE
ncbi:MAG: MgtC/SapB family protein [Bdellovibrionales bacterium]|nr:MgtC/SapB family protein [Bdellovibrionales bacterium]